MKKILLLIFTLSILTSCQNKYSTGGYLVKGVALNMPDSTKIVMYLYPKSDVVIDSTIILNERFRFKGKVERPRLAMLRIESTKDSRMFWLENQNIDITGEKGDFSNSKITGSKTQKEANLLQERKDSIHKEMKRIGEMVTDNNRDSLFLIHDKMIDEEARINKKFIEDYPNSYVSFFHLKRSKERFGPEETAKLFSLMSKDMQSSDEGKLITLFIELNKNPKVGEKYIDFVQVNINGQPIRLSEIKGKYTLIEFWASWCGPCRSSNPELLKEYELYKDKGFEIIGISLDTNKEKWMKAVDKDGLVWENVSDLKGANNKVAMIYGVQDLPDNFLIDEDGIIIARYLRGDNLKKKLKELFENKASL